MHLRKMVLFVMLFMATCGGLSFAEWSSNPALNNSISTAANKQDNMKIISDGNGGTIFVWQHSVDALDMNRDIYAQRIDSAGDAKWAVNGVVICNDAGSQYSPGLGLISDGNGGAIIVWQDNRADGGNIYAQRINSAGVSQWAANGVVVCDAADSQSVPQLITDGSGGAIIIWHDSRSVNWDIYAQRINSAGVSQWAANGVAVCSAATNQTETQLTSDGTGGAIIVWMDGRSDAGDVYAQRINSDGVVQWAANGVLVCNAANSQRGPQLITDGSGGAIVTWDDSRSGNYDIYAQRINSAGISQWAANGVAVCSAANSQTLPQLTSDGAGGATIVWEDLRGGAFKDIYSQRINSAGVSQWAANGVAVCTAANNQAFPQLINDGSGGAIVVWAKGVNYDIYAQRINSAGVSQWAADGVTICGAGHVQWKPRLSSDGSGGAIIVWEDYRAGNCDVYAQRVYAQGLLVPPPALSGGTVNPATGNTETNFTFSVTFTDATNTAPASIKVNIAGTDYNMIESDASDADLTNGKEYKYTTTLTAGTLTYKFSASNANGTATGDTGNHTIDVLPVPPIIDTVTAVPSSGYMPLSVTFGATITPGTGAITSYEWDFTSDGIYDSNSMTTAVANKEYPTAGTYIATLKITDSYSFTATKTVTVVVASSAPSLSVAISSNAPIYSGMVSFTGTGTAIPGRTIAKYEWDFDGDGSFDWSSTSSGSTEWMFITPGTYTAKMKVTDSNGESSEGSASFTVATPTVERALVFQPLDGETVSGSGVVINASVLPDTNVNYVKFYYRKKGDTDWKPVGEGDTKCPYTAIWDTGSLVDNQEYDLKATVALKERSAIDSETLTVIVDNGSGAEEYANFVDGLSMCRQKVLAAMSNTAKTASGASILVPYGALTSDTYVLIEEHIASEMNPKNGNVLFGNIFDMSIVDVTTPNMPCTISMPYVDDDNNGILDRTTVDIQDLKIYHYNETTKTWTVLENTVIDTTNKIVSGTTTGFSYFALAWDDPGELQDVSATSTAATTTATALDSSGGGGCFLATSAFEKKGSSNVVKNFTGKYVLPVERLKKLNDLRKFRDEKLLTNASGRTFIRLYYTLGPVAAEAIRDNEPLKAIVREILMPKTRK